MKRMISRIMLAALVLGSMPMHADLRSGVRTVLQSIGNNAGWTSLAAFSAIYIVAAHIGFSELIGKTQNEIHDIQNIPDDRTRYHIGQQWKKKAEERRDWFVREKKGIAPFAAIVTGYAAIAALGISTASSWLAKKI